MRVYDERLGRKPTCEKGGPAVELTVEPRRGRWFALFCGPVLLGVQDGSRDYTECEGFAVGAELVRAGGDAVLDVDFGFVDFVEDGGG